jgi:hypothetical protein
MRHGGKSSWKVLSGTKNQSLHIIEEQKRTTSRDLGKSPKLILAPKKLKKIQS